MPTPAIPPFPVLRNNYSDVEVYGKLVGNSKIKYAVTSTTTTITIESSATIDFPINETSRWLPVKYESLLNVSITGTCTVPTTHTKHAIRAATLLSHQLYTSSEILSDDGVEFTCVLDNDPTIERIDIKKLQKISATFKITLHGVIVLMLPTARNIQGSFTFTATMTGSLFVKRYELSTNLGKVHRELMARYVHLLPGKSYIHFCKLAKHYLLYLLLLYYCRLTHI